MQTNDRFDARRAVVPSGMRFADAIVPTEWAMDELIHAEFHGGRTAGLLQSRVTPGHGRVSRGYG
ncbi:hypothetical protein ACFHW1_27970, partial [Micromonospora sp. LOL_014]|uniref:hypothetical protein n=1 Tax=Micromonospora sp. LOL_014 TaxID=3345415 RepID=UPI003A87EE35